MLTSRRSRLVDASLAGGALLLLPGSEVIWNGVILAVYGLILARLYRDRDLLRRLLRSAWPALLPVLLALCSVWWSVDPALSAYRAIALVGTTAVGIFLAVRFSVADQLRLVALVLGIVACASAFVSLFLPSYGVMKAPLEGAWSGIFYHKNSLGRAMALAMVVYFLLAIGTSRWRTVWILALALCTALLALSRSQASLLVALAALGAVAALSAMQRLTRRARFALVIICGTLVFLTVLWAAHQRELMELFFGKDLTFTGRTVIWGVLWKTVRVHPWIGQGYGAFWRGPESVPEDLARALYGWYPIHAHNGFLDLALELGVAGVAVFLLPLLMYGRRAYVWGRGQRSPLCLWPVTYVLFLVLSNLAESALVRQNTLYWTLYVAAVLSTEAPRLPPIATSS